MLDREPPPHDHPLFALDNVILTPHSAGLSKEAAIRMVPWTARNVPAGADGKLDPSMVVNREALQRGAQLSWSMMVLGAVPVVPFSKHSNHRLRIYST